MTSGEKKLNTNKQWPKAEWRAGSVLQARFGTPLTAGLRADVDISVAVTKAFLSPPLSHLHTAHPAEAWHFL